jgi:pimeloyl-ACP methyl ester carboxylesterase
VTSRAGSRILDAPRFGPDERDLKPALDSLGGEVVRLRARDGLRLHARWLPAVVGDPDATAADSDRIADAGPVADAAAWVPDPYEAILVLHGWTGSVAPDLVALGPSLRRIAGVLGLDFRGHGGSDDARTTFGLREIEDVAGALDWLGERGIRRVALVGSSMGGTIAIGSVVALGDGSLAAADHDPFGPAATVGPPRPRIVAIVAESVPADLRVPIANRIPWPIGGVARRFVAGRMFAAASREAGGDLRALEPGRVVALVEPLPLLLVHGEADRTVPPAEGRRLAARAGPHAEQWVVPGADHGAARAADPAGWDDRIGRFLRGAFSGARDAGL